MKNLNVYLNLNREVEMRIMVMPKLKQNILYSKTRS
jgi:hypothetical protein